MLVLDEVAATRLSMLAALERVQIAGIGIASVDTGFGLLNENSVDLIVVRTDSAASMAPRLCQAIRRMPKQVNTPILVLLPEGDWERCAVLAMSGANEVIAGRLLNAELALKVLGHFFRGRLGGLPKRPQSRSPLATVTPVAAPCTSPRHGDAARSFPPCARARLGFCGQL